jgi:hypothetical protein
VAGHIRATPQVSRHFDLLSAVRIRHFTVKVHRTDRSLGTNKKAPSAGTGRNSTMAGYCLSLKVGVAIDAVKIAHPQATAFERTGPSRRDMDRFG